MKKERYSRRRFIQSSILAGSAILGTGFLISSCGGGETKNSEGNNNTAASVNKCDDLTGVSDAEITKRESLGYVDKTPIPESYCANCALFLKPKEGEKCGGCQLFKGPVFDEGYCTYWAAIT